MGVTRSAWITIRQEIHSSKCKFVATRIRECNFLVLHREAFEHADRKQCGPHVLSIYGKLVISILVNSNQNRLIVFLMTRFLGQFF